MCGWISTYFEDMRTTSKVFESRSRVDVEEQLIDTELARSQSLLMGVQGEGFDAAPVDFESIRKWILADHLHLFDVTRIVLTAGRAAAQAIYVDLFGLQ